ncbi:MAG: hypothetical protein ACOYNW_07020 [Undibacterium curvum]|uniref:hypothetical protein n=1 Tax=Undibacterium curvum TaxID=2762294 RepID=UPI003BD5B804
MFKKFNGATMLTIAALLSACGGGGGGTDGSSGNSGGAATASFSIGGTVSGLTAGKQVVLQNNAGDSLTVSANAAFTFAGKVNQNASYAVTVATQPAAQTCTVSNGTGSNVVANISNVAVNCVTDIAGVVTTLAGNGVGGTLDGIGVAAGFNNPVGIATDGSNVYVSDMFSGTIRKVVISTGAVSTLAGTPGSFGGSGTNDGIGAAARFSYPRGLYTDGTNLYVTSDTTVRKIVIATGAVTTLAGKASTVGNTDGTGSTALFNNPWGITGDGVNLYVTDLGSHTIRKIVIATGEVTTLVGRAGLSGSNDGYGVAALFKEPWGITTDKSSLYVTDSANQTIRKITLATTEVTTLAGKPGVVGNSNGTGAAASFKSPIGIATDGTNLFVSDSDNHTLRKIVIATGAVSTLAGTAGSLGSTDGSGAAARFYYPFGVATDGSSLYVADRGYHLIRKIR